MVRKTDKGRQKSEIKKIQDEQTRHVAFSKRRSGLFNKASELSILCGAQVGILVYSPAGRPYSFGHPGFQEVSNRFIPRNFQMSSPYPIEGGPQDDVVLQQLKCNYVQIMNRLDAAKTKGAMLKERLQKTPMGKEQAFETELEGFGMEELERFVNSYMNLKLKADLRVYTILNRGASSSAGPLLVNQVGMVNPLVSKAFQGHPNGGSMGYGWRPHGFHRRRFSLISDKRYARWIGKKKIQSCAYCLSN